MRTRAPNEQNVPPAGPSRPPELSDDVMEFILNSGPTAGPSASLPARPNGAARPTMILTTNIKAEHSLPDAAEVFDSPTLEDILGIADSSGGPLLLGSKRSRRPPPSADEEAMSEVSDAKRPRDAEEEIVRQRKALSARSSRQKHKEYVHRMETENERLRNNQAELEELNAAYKSRIQELENEALYLRRVISNDSAIARLVSALPGVEGVQLSSSLAPAPNVEAEFVTGGGVCLHLVDRNRVSLELCADCARRARSTRTAQPP